MYLLNIIEISLSRVQCYSWMVFHEKLRRAYNLVVNYWPIQWNHFSFEIFLFYLRIIQSALLSVRMFLLISVVKDDRYTVPTHKSKRHWWTIVKMIVPETDVLHTTCDTQDVQFHRYLIPNMQNASRTVIIAYRNRLKRTFWRNGVQWELWAS